MNSIELIPTAAPVPHRVEFFRLPAPGKRDPYFGLSRGWYYKAAALGEIKLVAVRQRGALRGVRLVVLDSVVAYIRRSEDAGEKPISAVPVIARPQSPVEFQQSFPAFSDETSDKP